MRNSFHKPRRGGGRRRSAVKRVRPRSNSSNRGRSKFKSKYINPEQFINKTPANQKEEVYIPKHTFLDFGFDAQVVKNLEKKNYKIPTRVQDQAIPLISNGKDVVGIANTGSGKTAAFVLPLIHKLKKSPKGTKVLVITPTRELAQQIQVEFKEFAFGMRLYPVVCVGGLSIKAQINELRRGPNFVIGTPGRLKDLITRGELKLERATTLVLDEADHMLDMGFLPDVKFIISKTAKVKQSLCFSATIAPEIKRLIEELLINPITISVRTSETGEHIAQDIIRAHTPQDKMRELTGMLNQDHFEKVLIFREMKHSAQKLAKELSALDFPAIAIHGNKSQSQRQRALDAFKRGQVNILVATSVAARGLDIPNVSHVINFDPPQSYEEYVHRIGRTGRAGKPGQAYTFVR